MGDNENEELDLSDEEPQENLRKNRNNHKKQDKASLSANSVYWINLFIAFIPLPGQISDFFASAATGIISPSCLLFYVYYYYYHNISFGRHVEGNP